MGNECEYYGDCIFEDILSEMKNKISALLEDIIIKRSEEIRQGLKKRLNKITLEDLLDNKTLENELTSQVIHKILRDDDVLSRINKILNKKILENMNNGSNNF